MNTTIKNDIMSVSISDIGAELQSIVYCGSELFWQGDKAVWERRSPLLFPIVGRLKDDTIKYNGKTYHLTKHGFAMDSVFEVSECDTQSVGYILRSDENTKKLYPFDFELRVGYTLCENHLKIAYTVINPGDDDIYFSLGAHPGFVCEMGDCLVFEKTENAPRLLMNSDSYICAQKEFLKGDTIEITKDLFKDDALIFEELSSENVTLKTRTHSIKVSFAPAPYLGIWAKPGTGYVCIEPWFGVDDSIDADCDFEQKKGIICLAGGREFNYLLDVEFAGRS